VKAVDRYGFVATANLAAILKYKVHQGTSTKPSLVTSLYDIPASINETHIALAQPKTLLATH